MPANFKDYVRNIAHSATQLALARATFLTKGPHISPSVSILIPVHNRLDLTRPCLESVFANADPSVPFELLLIDDVSADGTAEYLRSLGSRIRVIANKRRGCFGQNINRAAPRARGEYLCLLNNDTLVTPGWLTRLLAAARKDPTIGVVGNRHLTPGTDLINHAGMVFDNDRRPAHLHVGRPASFPPALVSREFQCVTGACWLVPKTLFLELGGFDPKFKNSYEDVDFCLRVRAHGRKVFYAADSLIYHYGHQSPGRLDNEVSNFLHFRSKWDAQIVSDLHDYLVRDGAQPEPSDAQAMRAPSIAEGNVAIHFAVPMDLGNAFSWVTARLALACADAGMDVSLRMSGIHETIDAADRQRLQRLMAGPARGRAHVRWAHYWQPYFEQELSGRINAELFVHNYRYGPQPTEKLDFWMRHVVTNNLRKLPATRACLDILRELGVPSDRCRIVPYGFSPEILDGGGANDDHREHGFVFLAITNSCDPHRCGTDILLSAFNRAFDGRKDVVLVLKDYGEGGLVRKWSDQFAPGCQIVHVDGFLTKKALIALYRGADAFVAPFRGEGFGMKILDACGVGLPVLAPHHGGPADYLQPGDFYALKHYEVPVGPCLDRNETIVPNFAVWAEVDCDDLARQLGDVMSHADEARRRAARCRDLVLREFSWERAAGHLASALEIFERERERIVTSRRQVPESKKLSVVIPTYNRKTELTTCLRAYQQQTLPRDQWEVLLVDDGSDYDVKATIAQFEKSVPLKLFTHESNMGPASARNLAIPHASGKIVFITGDDIIPSPQLLEQHLFIHESRDDPALAVVGHIKWHPSLKVSPLMNFVCGGGGYQFAFNRLLPNTVVSYGYFYASNVSLKRALLFDQEELFSDRFRFAAFEDIELGYRLERSGMNLYYAPAAMATHLHQMSDQDIYERQYRVGRMLVTYALLHPYLVEKRRDALCWLDVLQHVSDPAVAAIRAGQVARQFEERDDEWLNNVLRQALALAAVDRDSITDSPAWAARNGRALVDRSGALRDKIHELRIERAILDGIADEWFQIERGEPNPAREFLRNLMYEEILTSAVSYAPPLQGRARDRLTYIEALRSTRPLVASALRTVVRLSTSIAKRLN